MLLMVLAHVFNCIYMVMVGNQYVVYRMLPHGPCRFFFTSDGDPTPIIAKDLNMFDGFDATAATTLASSTSLNKLINKKMPLNVLHIIPTKVFGGVSIPR